MQDYPAILNRTHIYCWPNAALIVSLLLPLTAHADSAQSAFLAPVSCGEESPYRLQADPETRSAIDQKLAKKPYGKSIVAASRKAGLDPCLVHAIIAVESGYRQDAVSAKGAIGLMQVMPETGKRMGVKNSSASAEANLRAGTRYFSQLLKRYPGRLDLAIAAYNAGEGAVDKYGNRIPPFAETQAYVPRVMQHYHALKGTKPPGTPKIYLEGTRLNQASLK